MSLPVPEFHGIHQWHVDAFASKPFSGNPAAVVLQHGTVEWMQNVAMENNYAETSFLEKVEEGKYKLRWFTPTTEVELCGHATLAAAHVLYETAQVPPLHPIEFQTLHSGSLYAVNNADGAIELSFPATAPNAIDFTDEEYERFTKAFAIARDDVKYIGRSLYDLLIEVTPEAFVSLTTINHSLLEGYGGRGVLLTCEGGLRSGHTHHLQYDFLSRGFFPRYGINEDPVTGSAHCALAPYWFQRFFGFSKPSTANTRSETLIGYQVSKRGGEVRVTLLDEKVILGGKGVTAIKSKILVK